MRKSIVFALLIIAPLVSFAQYTGPNAKKIHYTVEDVKANGPEYDKEDHLVTLHGYIIEALAERNMYTFQDRTGTIKTYIDVDGLPHTPFDDKDLVVIIGHVKSKKGETSILVKKTLVLHVDLEELRKQNKETKMKVDKGIPMDSTLNEMPVKEMKKEAPKTPAKPQKPEKEMKEKSEGMKDSEEEIDEN